MRLIKTLIVTLPILALLGAHARDASACGGCFVQQSESTQVTGHRMILSTSNDATTLWDQITYSGDPAEFAWVLPTKGVVEIGLSSDALFEALEQYTQITVSSPVINCPPPPSCGDDFAAGAEDGSSGAGGGSPNDVQVLAQEVVGPFETVQLSADDPAALTDWLTSHNYSIPDEIVPVIASYVAEDFNFLALKLVPGEGVDSMRPVRVTTPGASPVLPLRMVAAGTGATTAVSLWVMGEGRYEPSNFPSFTIDSSALVWNWDTQSSNYKALRQAGFDDSGGLGWLVEAGELFSTYNLEWVLNDLVTYNVDQSGYGDDGVPATEALAEDLAALYGSLNRDSVWVSRLYGELPRIALEQDLELMAAADQSMVQRYFEATQSVGTPPACQEFPPCDDYGGEDPGGLDGIVDGSGGSDAGGPYEVGGGSCAVGAGGSASMLAGVGLALALAASRRRKGARWLGR
jgi:hypothetical protein